MKANRHLLRALGVLLLLPLAAALVGSVLVGANCEYDCGDSGGRGMFILVLLCTPVAAVGLLSLAVAGRRERDAPPTERPRPLIRMGQRAVVTPVVLCTLLLAGTAIAAGAAGVEKLTEEPQIHYVGDPDAGREQADEEGIFFLVAAAVLGMLACGAVLALGAARRTRR